MNGMFYEFFRMDVVSPVFKAFIIVVLFAMGMSTMDTHAYLFTSTIMRDFVRTSVRDNRPLYIRYSRYIMAGMMVFMTLLSLYYSSAVEVLMGIASIYSIAFPVMVVAAFGWIKPSRLIDIGFAGVQAIGIAVFLYMFWGGYFDAGFANAAIPAALTIALSLIWWGGVAVIGKRKTAPIARAA